MSKNIFLKKRRLLFIGILIFSLTTLIGSFVLSVDAVVLASNPDAVLNCDISKNISCSTVSQTWQAELLGFPNAFLGLMFEPVLIFLSVLILSKVPVKKWILVAVEILSLISLVFALWLFIQSAFVIKVLCPWCLLVCVSVIITFFLFLRYNSLNKTFGEKISKGLNKFSEVYAEYAFMILFLVFVLSTVVIKYL